MDDQDEYLKVSRKSRCLLKLIRNNCIGWEDNIFLNAHFLHLPILTSQHSTWYSILKELLPNHHLLSFTTRGAGPAEVKVGIDFHHPRLCYGEKPKPVDASKLFNMNDLLA